MPILLDGNNLLHRLPRARGRQDVRRLALDACRGQRRRVTVVFDGAPPDGTPARELLGAVTVLYSGPATADDLIVSRLPSGPQAREWVVVTDDRELARRVRERGASVRSLREWLRRETAPAVADERPLRPDDVAEWEAFFAAGRRDEKD